jgi:tetratricopeptide (TPR) repeat protein
MPKTTDISVRMFINQGSDFARQRHYQEALVSFSNAISIDPNNAEAFFNRGLTYQVMENLDQSLNDYTSAINFNPQWSNAYTNRGGVYVRLGAYQRAFTDYQQAIRLNPKDTLNYLSTAQFLFTVGAHRAAIAYANRSIELGDIRGYEIIRQIKMKPIITIKSNNSSETEIEFSDFDPSNLAFAEIQKCENLEDIQSLTSRYPFISEPWFIEFVKKSIGSLQLNSSDIGLYNKRLEWLKIINTKNVDKSQSRTNWIHRIFRRFIK